MSLRKISLGVISTSLLIVSLAGCASTKPVILKDREQIIPHPTNSDMVCLDKGYLDEIFEALGK